jgi:16S rRNA (guanine527-N7)-methyltransferase
LESPRIWLQNICRKNGLLIDDNQANLLDRYVALLLEWNQKINLVSRKDESRIWENHILHSISVLFRIRLNKHSVILDLGTGGGMPGIPLKILMPDAEVVLIDSTKKKIAAVEDMLVRLQLQGIRALWGRVEELSQQEDLKSHFDYIVARAVAPLQDLIEWSIPFLRHADQMDNLRRIELPEVEAPALIALKGGDLEEELRKAERKKTFRSVNTVNLVFHGSEEISSPDKKLVIVKF